MAKIPGTDKLTRRQKDAVALAVQPEFKTIADVARALGTTRQAAHVILTRDDVRAIVERERARRLDKTGGIVERLGRIAARVTDELDNRDLASMDEAYLAGVLKTALESQEKAAKIAAGLADKDRDRLERLRAGEELRQRKVAQAVRVGRYLERRAMRASATTTYSGSAHDSPPAPKKG